MDNVTLIRSLLTAIEKSDFDGATALMDDGLMFSGATPEPIPGAAWLGLHRVMNAACSDFSFNLTDVHEQGDKVIASVALSGTQQNALDLTAMHMMVVAPTGKKFQLPMETLTFSVMNDKASQLETAHVEGGGLMGILGQLGVEMPHHN